MAPLTLTILGAGPAAPNPGGANSGYLVRQGDTAVVMDLGPGNAGRIALHMPPHQLSAVAISHFHPDHYFDLVALYYTIKYGEPRPRLTVFVPPGGRQFLDRLGQLIADREAMLEDVFELKDYAPDREISIDGLSFSFHAVQHYVPAFAMRVRDHDGRVLVFSGDVAPCPQIVEAARQADLFLCESALLDRTQDDPNPSLRGHMTAADAGAAAQEAGARRLVITHYRSGEDNDARHLASARSTFKGPIELAEEGKTYTL